MLDYNAMQVNMMSSCYTNNPIATQKCLLRVVLKIIRTMKNDYGSVYLVNYRRHPMVRQYTRGRIEYGLWNFAVPELSKDIVDYSTALAIGEIDGGIHHKEIRGLLEKLISVIHANGGITLTWGVW